MMGNKLEFGKYMHGQLTYNTGTNLIDTSYISLETQGEGPFFIYYQLNYDMQYEGEIALALHKYDKATTSFEENQLYVL